MIRTAIDSSVLILLQRRQPGWEERRDRLTQAAFEGPLLISPVVFAECSFGYPSAAIALRELGRAFGFLICSLLGVR